MSGWIYSKRVGEWLDISEGGEKGWIKVEGDEGGWIKGERGEWLDKSGRR